MKNRLMITMLILFAVFAGNVQATQWKLDPPHSSIQFDINHIFAVVSGQFTEFEADVVFDPQYLGKARFDFSVNVKSVNTLNNKRDNHLRSKDFFDADKFLVMTFKSSRITHVKDNQYALEGMMTIKDVQRPAMMEFTFYGPRVHPLDTKSLVAGFETSFKLNRLDFHVGDGKFYKMGVVDDMVNIRISVEGLTDK
ncbi:MAG: YceI family protein [Pseudomonadota bacterium]